MIEYNEFISKNSNWHKSLIGSGTTAHCFKLPKNLVYKLFDLPIPIDDPLFSNIISFENLDSKYIVFPQDIVVDDVKRPRQIYGYTTPYKEERFVKNAKIADIISKIKFLESEVIYLAKEHNILMNDLWLENVIFTGEEIYLIDTDYYVRYDEYNEEIKKDNLTDTNNVVFQTLTNVPLYIFNYCYLPRRLGKIHRSVSSGDERISLFLNEYIKYLENIVEKEIITIGDLKVNADKVLNRSRKRKEYYY